MNNLYGFVVLCDMTLSGVCLCVGAHSILTDDLCFKCLYYASFKADSSVFQCMQPALVWCGDGGAAAAFHTQTHVLKYVPCILR